MFEVVSQPLEPVSCLLDGPKCDGRGRERDSSEGGLTLRTHFVHSVPLKSHMVAVEIEMFQCADWPSKVILSLLASLNCDLNEVEKTIFQGVTCPCGLIFYLLTSIKFDLNEVEKAMIQGVAWLCQLI